MLPRSKFARALFVVAPLALVALLWNAARQRPRFVATPVPAQSLALSYDGKQLAVATKDNSLLWRENQEFRALPVDKAGDITKPYWTKSMRLQFSRDGRTLLGANIGSGVGPAIMARAWELTAPETASEPAWSQDIHGYVGTDNQFVFSPNGRKLALLSYNVVKVLDVSGAQALNSPTLMRVELKRPRQKKGRSTGLFGRPMPAQIAWTADGENVIVMDHVERLQFWNVAKKQLVSRSSRAPLFGGGATLAASPDGRFVALCEIDGLALWDVTTKKWSRISQRLVLPRALAWMPDSRSLWLGTNVSTNNPDGRTRQLSAPELKTLRVLPAYGPLALSGDGRTLATRDNEDKGVWLWNVG